MYIVYTTDWHLRLSRPVSRTDENFLELQYNKVKEVFSIAQDKKADFILFGGDLFDRAKPEFALLNAIVSLFVQYNSIPFYAVPGNHDLVGYQLKTIHNTAFWNLVESKLITFLDEIEINGVSIKGVPFSSSHTDNYIFPKRYDIIVSHNMITPSTVPYTHTVAQNIKTNAKVLLCGHYHYPFTVKVGETKVINPGALLRLDATDSDVQRFPQILLIDTDNDKFVLTRLTSAQEGIKVFDMEKINATVESFAHFFSSLESIKTRSFIIADVIRQLGKELGEDAIEEALHRIEEVEKSFK